METLRKQLETFIEARDGEDTRLLREVAGAADLAAVLKNNIDPPAVYIIRGAQRRKSTGHTITVTEQMMVCIAVSNVRDPRGGDSSDDAQVWSQRITIDQVTQALIKESAVTAKLTETKNKAAAAAQSILERLDPARKITREYGEDLAVLSEALKTGAIDQYDFNAAVGALDAEAEKARAGVSKSVDGLVSMWNRGMERIDDTIGDVFRNLVKGGKASFSEIGDLFQDLLAEMLYAAARNKIVVGLSLASAGPTAAASGGAGGGTGLLNSVSSAFSAGKSLLGFGGSGSSGILGAGFNYLRDGYQAVGEGLMNLGAKLGNPTVFNAGLSSSATGNSYTAGSNLSNLGQAGLNVGAGFAGNYLGNLAFGDSQYGNVGGTVGGAIGSIWGPIGTAIGSFIGNGLASLVGGKQRADKEGNTIDFASGEVESFNRHHNKEFRSAVDGMSDTLLTFSELIGGSTANLKLTVHGKDGLKLDSGGGDVRFDEASALMDAAFESIVDGATSLDPVLQSLIGTFDSSVDNVLQMTQDALRFFIVNPEVTTATVGRRIDSTKTYSDADAAEYESILPWKDNGLTFPHNIATGWFFNDTESLFVYDYQQQSVIDMVVEMAVQSAKDLENPENDYLFAGIMWDVQDLRGDFWTGAGKTGGKFVQLSHWNGKDSCAAESHVHAHETYRDGKAAYYKQLYTRIREEFPEAKFVGEPFLLYQRWIKELEDRDDGAEIMSDMLMQEANGIEFAEDRNFASGMIARDHVGSTTPRAFSVEDNLLIASTAAINGSWYNWFGKFGGDGEMPNYQSIRDVPARLKLIRMIPSWDNLWAIPLSMRSWDGSKYSSITSYADSAVIYSRQPITSKVFAVFLEDGGTVKLHEGEVLESIMRTDSLFIETVSGVDDITYSNNEIRLSDQSKIGEGYIIATRSKK